MTNVLMVMNTYGNCIFEKDIDIVGSGRVKSSSEWYVESTPFESNCLGLIEAKEDIATKKAVVKEFQKERIKDIISYESKENDSIIR